MKKMYIYEPSMCCPTGLCGVSVDSELLRVSAIVNSLVKNGVKVERFNLSNSPQEFVNNKDLNERMMNEGIEILPVIVVDGKILITKRYPTNEEFVNLLEVPATFLGETQKQTTKLTVQPNSGGCGCSDGKCC